jgi:acyl-CoA hydrolase
MPLREESYVWFGRKRAYFVMVAMGDNGKPTPVPGLILENEGERMEWDNAIKRRELRLVRKKEGF